MIISCFPHLVSGGTTEATQKEVNFGLNALSNQYPEAKSVGLWLKHGWHVALAYVIGFFVLLAVLGFHPDAHHKSPREEPAKAAATLKAQ